MENAQRLWTSVITIVVSLVIALEILTFRKFFFFNPFAAGYPLVSVAQLMWFAALFAVLVLPPVLVVSARISRHGGTFIFGVVAVAWPTTIILIRVAALISTGNPYMGYLTDYPIFIFSDLAVPVLYLWMWRRFVAAQRDVSGYASPRGKVAGKVGAR